MSLNTFRADKSPSKDLKDFIYHFFLNNGISKKFRRVSHSGLTGNLSERILKRVDSKKCIERSPKFSSSSETWRRHKMG